MFVFWHFFDVLFDKDQMVITLRTWWEATLQIRTMRLCQWYRIAICKWPEKIEDWNSKIIFFTEFSFSTPHSYRRLATWTAIICGEIFAFNIQKFKFWNYLLLHKPIVFLWLPQPPIAKLLLLRKMLWYMYNKYSRFFFFSFY